ncbi:PQQ-dependent sugar dehydrogenase [Halorussus gelatinilyticus]|uniref:PQQ-dependent sugar dehydrogenase n=1 Tax=Halorussus gelatinilyticus TaxID=2937524 RepID=A0A8U0INF6_9EURY|nr:PQQ-dependent sugar dehydrogenase [Halorussus gelatinilyticus]UPW01982.1 PQQ-dependent sugar dehydrogenase [Halorussus gelatinilyticus]
MTFDSNRRRFLALAAAGGAVGLAGCSGGAPSAGRDATAETTATTDSGGRETATAAEGDSLPEAVGLETLATGFEVPLDVAFAPDADRRYVADQRGRVFVHESGGLRDRPFLDLRETVTVGSETGLLGIALHPNFAENRRVFVRYSAPPRTGTPDGYSHTFVLSEFEATANGRRARRDSERTILEIPEPQGNHNAGSVLFGPDGYLYVGVGDGGSGGDRGTGHVEDWYDAVAGGNGQDVTENLLGSVLRIDIDNQQGDRNYAIPEDNPFAGDDEGLPEHFAWGFRNPWRMAFDRGDLLVADVGQSAYEEVSLVEKGGNYGWNVEEGAHCYSADDCPDSTPSDVRGGEPLRDPVIEYPHSGEGVTGVSVIGGEVYRGSAVPDLSGTYLFADLSARGRLFAATPPESRDGGGTADGANSDDGLWPTAVVDVADDDAGKVSRVYSFGRDADGEVYVLSSGDDGGGLHRVAPA